MREKCLSLISYRKLTGLVLPICMILGQCAFSAAPFDISQQNGSTAFNINLRQTLETWELKPRLQGGRGTCSVFTVAGALEYALAHKTGQGTPLSVEFLNWASNQTLQKMEDGSFFSDLWNGFTTYGVCPEQDMPYQNTFDPKRTPSQEAREHALELLKAGFRLQWIKPWNPNTGLTEEQLSTIKRVLYQKWPVCGGFRWPKKPVKYNHNILIMPPPEGVIDGHSVLIVGYQDDPNQPGGGLFLFRNSNNEGHYGYMTYQYACAYMNDAVWINYETENAQQLASPTITDILGPFGFSPKGRNRRISSNQQPDWHSENLDMNWLMPGESVNMPMLEGPGVINHIWFTSHSGWVSELNSLSLRIYYDDNKEPGVEAPVGDFFAVGHGKPAVVNSIPVQVSPTGSLTCYWRMPFRKNARIVVTNDNPDRSTGLYWQVDWLQLEDLPLDTPYFYARYRQEYPAVEGCDYLIADLKGSGFFVGTVMSITLGQNGWFGEGDDFFYIDGETIPSLQGTGSEDYFNDAWGFRTRTSAWFGQPYWQGYTAGDSGVCYRWHLLDPVHFTRSLKVEIEHRGNCNQAENGFYLERSDFLSSVAFWYQTGTPETMFSPLPSWHQRCVPWRQYHLVKTYRHAKTTGPAKLQVQTQGFFGARPILLWPNDGPRAALTLPFELSQEGRYAIRLTAANGPAYGMYDVEIDGKKVLTADFRTPDEAEADLVLGIHEMKQGNHTIAFRAVDDAQKVGPLGVEILRLLKLPPEAERIEKTHHEAHFIRLGIGRAVYAYRLAFDTLPDTLETLVNKGFMPDRYLRDENNLPLKSWRQNDTIFVESTGKDHWKHSWKGLDPRR
ncbi:MAG: DUF2961 domain-containing protein [Sedimentisphaerales bacterium]|nr:DUF2961 domain-containing protein [Sedimentisphaerales bacterium]